LYPIISYTLAKRILFNALQPFFFGFLVVVLVVLPSLSSYLIINLIQKQGKTGSRTREIANNNWGNGNGNELGNFSRRININNMESLEQ